MSDELYFPVLGGGSRVSSDFGNRSSPGGFGSTNHRGIDIAAQRGTPVIAPIGGRIEVANNLKGYGNAVYLRGDDGMQYRFAHLNNITVRQGMMVQGGATLGGVGSTGNSTGNHLHFEVRDGKGNVLNPKPFLDRAIKNITGGNVIEQAGNFIDDATTAAKDAALTALDKALEAVPYVGSIWSGAKASGIPNIFDAAKGECGLNPICHLRNWLDETGFVSRLAIALLAFIFIAVALTMLGRNVVPNPTFLLKGK